jgi:hypothetical protein
MREKEHIVQEEERKKLRRYADSCHVKVKIYIDQFCWRTISNQHMQLIERLPYALCHFHTRSFILRSHVHCLPTCIFRAFSILLHVHCAPFLSFSTIYVLLQLVTLLASMHIAIFRYFVFLMLLPVHTFFLHSVPLFRSINASITSVEARLATNICG